MERAEILKQLRQSSSLTMDEVGKRIGVSKQTIYKYENGIVTNIPSDKIELLAELYGIRPGEIMGWYDHVESLPINRIKVFGSIPAGIPIEAIEEHLEWVDIPTKWTLSGQKYTALKVKGDSMVPKYEDGDIVIIKIQQDCESGQDAIVYVNGEDATLKKLVKREDRSILLQPLNPEYQPLMFSEEEVGSLPVSILGIVVEIRRRVV